MTYSNMHFLRLRCDEIASNYKLSTINSYKSKAMRERNIELAVHLFEAELLCKFDMCTGLDFVVKK